MLRRINYLCFAFIRDMATKKIPARKSIPQECRWDLKPLFKDDQKWQAIFDDVEHKLESYSHFRGRLGDSLAVFKDAIAFDLSIRREIEKLYTYAHLKSDEDKSNQL